MGKKFGTAWAAAAAAAAAKTACWLGPPAAEAVVELAVRAGMMAGVVDDVEWFRPRPGWYIEAESRLPLEGQQRLRSLSRDTIGTTH